MENLDNSAGIAPLYFGLSLKDICCCAVNIYALQARALNLVKIKCTPGLHLWGNYFRSRAQPDDHFADLHRCNDVNCRMLAFMRRI